VAAEAVAVVAHWDDSAPEEEEAERWRKKTSVGNDSIGDLAVEVECRYRCGRVYGRRAYRGLAGCGLASSGGDARGSQSGSGQHGLRLTVSSERREGGGRSVSNEQ
jgi:hypothetical protein